MKSLKSLLFLSGILALLTSCLKDHCSEKYRAYFPIYKSRESLLGEVGLKTPMDIVSAGKIFIYGNYIFINDVDKGIHIIDNTSPASPKQIGFLNIQGNLDLWVKNNLLYADCFDNLLVLDISQIQDIHLVESLPNVFPQRLYDGITIDENKGYIIGWEQRDTTVTIECGDNGNIFPAYRGANGFYALSYSSSNNSSFVPPVGIAGSLTRFNVTGNYLYCIDNSTIHSFNIGQQKPLKQSDVPIGFGIETIYSSNNNLFLGTTTGVLIYSLSNPALPAYINKMQHVRTCDPVITDGVYSFLTLRGGSPCGGFTNQMDVLDVKDLNNVSLIKSYPLNNPYGLGMDNKYIFICDDGYGVRIFDRYDIKNMVEKNKISVENPRDIIVLNQILLIMTDKNIVQYDFSDINNVQFISKLN